MVNSNDFAIRIKKLLNFYNLSAAQFADKISVQRSSISHLLSGRNKPSLDFVLKVVKQFNEVDLYWLLNGRGKFPKSNNPDKVANKESYLKDSEKKGVAPDLLHTNKSDTAIIEEKTIEHIIIFYKDGSFKKYKAI